MQNRKPFKKFSDRQEENTERRNPRPFVARATGGRPHPGKPGEKTSWNPIAKGYSEYLEGGDTVQRTIVFPGAKRLLEAVKGERVIDIACGEGSFAALIAKDGVLVNGIDIASDLVRRAQEKKIRGAQFQTANAKEFARYFRDVKFDGAVCILALQNIDNLNAVVQEATRVLKPGGRFVFVLNHPSFRIPRQTSWVFDEKRKLMQRSIDAYLSPNEIPIVANPSRGQRSSITYSYHRPLQDYITTLAKHGFAVDGMEEWSSDKESTSGPRAKAENRSRAEIPLFMAIRARKLS